MNTSPLPGSLVRLSLPQCFRNSASAPTRVRLLSTRALSRLGFREDTFLIFLAVLIGLITAAAAVTFHEIIDWTRSLMYEQFGFERLYGRWVFMLIAWPALGG